MSEKENVSEEICGYARPPTHSRWTKGQSGNRRGRPRGSRNFYTLLQKIVDENVTVQQNGKTIRLSKKEVAILKAANAAASGDTKALSLLLPHLLIADSRVEQQEAQQSALHTSDEQIISDYFARTQKTGDENARA